jgi:hypothetical protein
MCHMSLLSLTFFILTVSKSIFNGTTNLEFLTLGGKNLTILHPSGTTLYELTIISLRTYIFIFL